MSRLAIALTCAALPFGCGRRSVPSEPPSPTVKSVASPVVASRPVAAVTDAQSTLDPAILTQQPASEYVIGVNDLLQVSVYGYTDLAAAQAVRPDGKIAFPLIGSAQAAGLTPERLQEEIAARLAEFVRQPRVTVIVAEYNSRRVISLGELNAPGIVPFGAEMSLVEGISRAGGLTTNADLRGAMVVREGKILPVNLERLLRQGDFTQNVLLRPNDVILVPNVSARKIFVLGEVRDPQVVTANLDVSLVEAIALAGGLTRDAEQKNILVVRGGLSEPQLIAVDLRDVAEKGDVSKNISLVPGDLVYVPRSTIADVVEFFNRIRDIVAPIVLVESLVTTERPVVVTP